MEATRHHLFVSNSTASVRMFERDWMEALSKVHFIVPVVVFVPILAFFLWRALERRQPLEWVAAAFVAGIAIWTLTEYLLHRFVFHYLPRSAWGKKLHFIMHGVHHDYPNDAKRLVMPPSASLPLAVLFYALFWLALPHAWVDAAYAGFVLGYIVYDEMHYAVHHARFRNPWLKAIKRNHMQHHFVDPNHGFGVSSPLWDRVFRS